MKNKILPPTYFLISFILIIVSHFIFPIIKIIHLPYNWIGVILIIFGSAINLWVDNIFKKKETTVNPYEKPNILITSGPFRLSRHPMYLGMTTILFGIAILLGSLISFIFPIIFAILMQKLFIPVEEKNLEILFGQKYLNYKKKINFGLKLKNTPFGVFFNLFFIIQTSAILALILIKSQ